MDLSGVVVWRLPESESLEFPSWAGPSRLIMRDASQSDNLGEPPTFSYISLPDGATSPAPSVLSVSSSWFSPNGLYTIEGTLEDCALKNVVSGERVVEGGCGLGDWTADSRYALVWDVACSSIRDGDSDRCIAGRFQGFATPEPEPEDDSDEDVYVPGPACDPAEQSNIPITPSDATPLATPDAATPEYYTSLERFFEADFKVRYVACMNIEREPREVEVSWTKDGTKRARFDVPFVMDDKLFELTYIMRNDDVVICSARLGAYLKAVFGPFDREPRPFGADPRLEFAESVEPLTKHQRSCISDPYGALFFWVPFSDFSDDPFSDAGVEDPMAIDEYTEADPQDDFGSYVNAGTRTIAGHEATCYHQSGYRASMFCFGADGVLLSASGRASLVATSVESMEEEDFEPPHDIRAEIARCFPREVNEHDAVDLDEALDDGDMEKALKSALLVFDDLDCGWEYPLEDEEEDEDADSSCSLFCCTGTETRLVDMVEVSREFAQIARYGSVEPYQEDFLRQTIRYDEGDGALEYMDRVRQYWIDCAVHTFENERGEIITARTTEIDLDEGDDSAAFLMTFNHPAYGDYVFEYIRVGKLVTSLMFYDGSLGIRDPERRRVIGPALQLSERVVEKLRELDAKLP
jgi:hypothetical protein